MLGVFVNMKVHVRIFSGSKILLYISFRVIRKHILIVLMPSQKVSFIFSVVCVIVL